MLPISKFMKHKKFLSRCDALHNSVFATYKISTSVMYILPPFHPTVAKFKFPKPFLEKITKKTVPFFSYTYKSFLSFLQKAPMRGGLHIPKHRGLRGGSSQGSDTQGAAEKTATETPQETPPQSKIRGATDRGASETN